MRIVRRISFMNNKNKKETDRKKKRARSADYGGTRGNNPDLLKGGIFLLLVFKLGFFFFGFHLFLAKK